MDYIVLGILQGRILSLLQGIFPTQGSNPGLLHCRQILYQLSLKGSPENVREGHLWGPWKDQGALRESPRPRGKSFRVALGEGLKGAIGLMLRGPR